VQTFKIAVGQGRGDGEVQPEGQDQAPNQAPGQRNPNAPAQQRGDVRIGKPSLAAQFDKQGFAARKAGTDELMLAARKAAQPRTIAHIS
jgi:hypothetical protein